MSIKGLGCNNLSSCGQSVVAWDERGMTKLSEEVYTNEGAQRFKLLDKQLRDI